MSRRVIVLFSGGIDSTVMLWKLIAEHWNPVILGINYYKRNPREIEAAERITRLCEYEDLITLDLTFVRELFDFEPHLRDRWMEILASPPSVMAPFRNVIFYSIAAHMAIQYEAEAVAGGHTLEDQTNLPDANISYLARLNELLDESLGISAVRIIAPLIRLTKPQIVRLGARLGAPLSLTWSCWKMEQKHCGHCPGCQSRRQAFREAGQRDETQYLEDLPT